MANEVWRERKSRNQQTLNRNLVNVSHYSILFLASSFSSIIFDLLCINFLHCVDNRNGRKWNESKLIDKWLNAVRLCILANINGNSDWISLSKLKKMRLSEKWINVSEIQLNGYMLVTSIWDSIRLLILPDAKIFAFVKIESNINRVDSMHRHFITSNLNTQWRERTNVRFLP